MEYRAALEIDIRHDYWGDAPAPFRVSAADPSLLQRAGLVLRSGGPGAVLVAPVEIEEVPVRVTLDIIADDTQLIGLTRGWRSDTVPVFAPELATAPGDDVAQISISPTDSAQSDLPRRPGDRRLCQLDLPFDPARFPITCTVACETVQALWAYHIVGKGSADPIRVVDDTDKIAFDDLGEEVLPNGRTARVLRSSTPVPIRQRNAIRLALKEDQPPPYDPETLIPVLPVGGSNLRPIPGATPADILQSDIYVSL